MAQESVQDIIKSINANLTQVSSSTKDENTVMRAMLNDRSYVVDVYGKMDDGKFGVVNTYCPSTDARVMIANIISNTAKIPAQEASVLAENYDFRKTDADTMINIGKEFVNTYLQTGRKLPLGGREKSNAALTLKHSPETKKSFVMMGKNGQGKGETIIPAHDVIKSHNRIAGWYSKESK